VKRFSIERNSALRITRYRADCHRESVSFEISDLKLCSLPRGHLTDAFGAEPMRWAIDCDWFDGSGSTVLGARAEGCYDVCATAQDEGSVDTARRRAPRYDPLFHDVPIGRKEAHGPV